MKPVPKKKKFTIDDAAKAYKKGSTRMDVPSIFPESSMRSSMSASTRVPNKPKPKALVAGSSNKAGKGITKKLTGTY